VVKKAFDARAVTMRERTSALGKPLCTFTLTSSNAGGPGTVIMTVDTASSPKSFQQAASRASGAQKVTGIGDAAFYVNDTGTIDFIKGSTAVVVQATFRIRAGTKYAARIKADVLAVSKVIVAQI
jgi:hypothetical protein